MGTVTAILIIYVIALIIDIPYLWLRMDYHKTFFMGVQKEPLTVRYTAAAIVYILFAIAIYYVAIKDANTLQNAITTGAVVGAIMYGFYDATNMATLRGWTWDMAILDTLWGATAGALVSGVGFYAIYKIQSKG